MEDRLARCTAIWSDKGPLDPLAALVEADATIHDCHRVKGHAGDHQCACGKKISPR